jgi:hypothetical protein
MMKGMSKINQNGARRDPDDFVTPYRRTIRVVDKQWPEVWGACLINL